MGQVKKSADKTEKAEFEAARIRRVIFQSNEMDAAKHISRMAQIFMGMEEEIPVATLLRVMDNPSGKGRLSDFLRTPILRFLSKIKEPRKLTEIQKELARLYTLVCSPCTEKQFENLLKRYDIKIADFCEQTLTGIMDNLTFSLAKKLGQEFHGSLPTEA